jgi:putative transposase
MQPPPDPHYRHRFPAEIIGHAVWLYHVFSLSLRDVELILAERGIVVSYETVRRWCMKFGPTFADRLRRRRPRPGDKWYLDEVFIRIQGVQHYLWRAVDQDGVVLDILVQARRDATAAKRFLRRLLKGLQYVPRVIVTDKLRSYGVAQRQLLPAIEHRQSRYLNNRAENSHRPTRRRERQCNGSSRPGKPKTSSPPTHSSTVTFIPAGIDLQRIPIARSGRTPLMSGIRKRAAKTQRNRHGMNDPRPHTVHARLT